MTSAEIRQFLRPDEAFLSFYFGRANSFVWAVPKQGPIRFTRIALSARELDAKVSQAARGAGAAGGDDLGYSAVRSCACARALQHSCSSRSRTAGNRRRALSSSPTARLACCRCRCCRPRRRRVDQEKEPMFSGYRDVPWLARTHAVTVIPSANALRTLRRTPPDDREARTDDRVRRSGVLKGAGRRKASAAPDARVAEMATRGVPLRRRASPQLDGVSSAEPCAVAAPAGHRRRTQVDRACACRPIRRRR